MKPFTLDELHHWVQQVASENVDWAIFRPPHSPDIWLYAGQADRFESADQGFVVQPWDRHAPPMRIPYRECRRYASGLEMPAQGKRGPDRTFPAGDSKDKTYQQLVLRSLQAIEEGQFQKVVPARACTRLVKDSFHPASVFSKLLVHYPAAAVHWLHLSNHGTWMGASPEILIRYHAGQAQTMALAGTIASDDPSAGFSKKEREEQRQVATLIRSVLSAHKVDWEESATQRVTYGPVSHLQSMFEIRGREGRSLQRAEVLRMARDLHPTPAVCGWPRDAAWHFLERAEPMLRALYAGYLGPVHENDLALYVNLRCMQWHGDRATFYAGAGVVPGSDPDAEWAETERKMQTLLRFIPIAEDDVHRQNANAGSGASK